MGGPNIFSARHPRGMEDTLLVMKQRQVRGLARKVADLELEIARLQIRKSRFYREADACGIGRDAVKTLAQDLVGVDLPRLRRLWGHAG